MEDGGQTVGAALSGDYFNASLLLAAAAIALGGVVRGFAGFGAAMIMVPIVSWLYSAIDAVVACALLELVGFLPLLSSAARHSHWRDIGLMGVTSLLAVPLGVWLLVALDPFLVRRLFSIMVLVFVAILASGWHYKGRAPVPALVAAGGLSGTLAGLANMGGPPVVLFFLSRKQDAKHTRASIIMLLMAQTFLALGIYFVSGLVTYDLFLRCLFWAPIYVLALWSGSHLFGMSADHHYRNVALAILAVIGVATLFA